MSGVSAAAVTRIRLALEKASLPDRPDFESSRRAAVEALAAIEHRCRRREGEALPPIRLLCGPSGGGKSSLFNALVGRDLSKVSSVERPATRGALCALGGSAGADTLLPTLARIELDANPGGQPFSLIAVPAPALPFQILIDGPDYDSFELRNRALVDLLLPWADEAIFVTSLERYADRSAAPVLTRLAALGTPLMAVLNKVEGDEEALLADFARQIEQNGGPQPFRIAALSRRSGGIATDDPLLNDLRAAPPGGGPRDEALLAETRQSATKVLEPALEEWRKEIGALRADLVGLVSIDDQLQEDERVRKLEVYEESSKFWLRYSPRGVLRGLREVVSDPGRLFRSTEVPQEPEEDALLQLVLEQAGLVHDRLRIRARETMKRHRPGRLLVTSEAIIAAERDPGFLADRMRPIAQELHAFGRARIDTFRKEWSRHRQGLMARARFWAVDKVLRLLSLCLTVAVLPPLIWELLRFIGHPAFTNEVTAEFHRARAAFRDAMAEIEVEQVDDYMAAIEALGPDEAAVAEFRAALSALSRRERST